MASRLSETSSLLDVSERPRRWEAGGEAGGQSLFKVTWDIVGNVLITVVSVRRKRAKLFGRGVSNWIYFGKRTLSCRLEKALVRTRTGLCAQIKG